MPIIIDTGDFRKRDSDFKNVTVIWASDPCFPPRSKRKDGTGTHGARSVRGLFELLVLAVSVFRRFMMVGTFFAQFHRNARES